MHIARVPLYGICTCWMVLFWIENRIIIIESQSADFHSLDDYIMPYRGSLSSSKKQQRNSFENASRVLNVDPERDFHIPAHQQIQSLVNKTNILAWKITTDKFFQEFNLTDLLSPALPIERIHGRPDSEKQKVWSDIHQYYVWETNICFAARGFSKAGKVKPHVLFTYCNENRGAFSRDIPNRTVEWDSLATHWKSWGCSDEEISAYLDHPNTRAVVTTQHQSYSHPKIISIPLGIRFQMKWPTLAKIQRDHPQPRTQLLMINDNGWRHRAQIAARINSTFGCALKNTYTKSNSTIYLEELQRSKFILAPSGFGYDCYRIWDALYMGTIPIVEIPTTNFRKWRNFFRGEQKLEDGWRRTFEELPVLWVHSYDQVTPEFLEQKYREIAANNQQYNYLKLTIDWWIEFVRSRIPEDVTTTTGVQSNGKPFHLKKLNSTFYQYFVYKDAK
jgi:hypothetical protein